MTWRRGAMKSGSARKGLWKRGLLQRLHSLELSDCREPRAWEKEGESERVLETHFLFDSTRAARLQNQKLSISKGDNVRKVPRNVSEQFCTFFCCVEISRWHLPKHTSRPAHAHLAFSQGGPSLVNGSTTVCVWNVSGGSGFLFGWVLWGKGFLNIAVP